MGGVRWMQVSQFRSKDGDEWIFEYSAQEDKAVVRGSDIGWEPYPVVEGIAFQLNMSLDEEAWLLGVWNRLVPRGPGNPLYGTKHTKLEVTKEVCQLTNGFCPICLEQKNEYQNHHCVWRSRGGSDENTNPLRICGSCHALIHWGSVEDRAPKSLACLYHQLSYFGLEVFAGCVQGLRAERFLDCYPRLRSIVWKYHTFDDVRRDKEQEIVKQQSRLLYIYYRDMGLGKWCWQEYQRRRGWFDKDGMPNENAPNALLFGNDV